MGAFVQFLLGLFKSISKSSEAEVPDVSSGWSAKENHLSLISPNGLSIIAQFEGLRLKPYPDVVGIPTIGYGTTYYEDGTKVTLNDPEISPERAYQLLAIQANKLAVSFKDIITVELNQNQLDALGSFAYNIGIGAFKKSNLLKLLNKGDYLEASMEFGRWDKAGGKVIDGLQARRKLEYDLFIS